MSKFNNEEKLAQAVYPNDKISSMLVCGNVQRLCGYGSTHVCQVDGQDFDLRQVDENGNPTRQAKISAFDVLMWMLKSIWFKQQQSYLTKRQLVLLMKTLLHNNTNYYCTAIFYAAIEIIKEPQDE